MSRYKGIEVADPSDAADVPAAMKAMVDSGMIPRFGNSSARSSQIGAPENGMLSFRSDVKQLELHLDGTWKNIQAWGNLDGKPERFPPVDHADNYHTVEYLRKSGGTMTGNLSLGQSWPQRSKRPAR